MLRASGLTTNIRLWGLDGPDSGWSVHMRDAVEAISAGIAIALTVMRDVPPAAR